MKPIILSRRFKLRKTMVIRMMNQALSIQKLSINKTLATTLLKTKV
jgi:hypothetical protein